jgi:hypothetical protein
MIRKVRIKDIVPNPHRHRETHDPKAIKSLAESIGKVGFWGGLRGRDQDGHVELCFGHRRYHVVMQLVECSDPPNKAAQAAMRQCGTGLYCRTLTGVQVLTVYRLVRRHALRRVRTVSATSGDRHNPEARPPADRQLASGWETFSEDQS